MARRERRKPAQEELNRPQELEHRAAALLSEVREFTVARRLTEFLTRVSLLPEDLLFAIAVSSTVLTALAPFATVFHLLGMPEAAGLFASLTVLSTGTWALLFYRMRDRRRRRAPVEQKVFALDEEIRKAESNPRTPPDVLDQLYKMKLSALAVLTGESIPRHDSGPRLGIK